MGVPDAVAGVLLLCLMCLAVCLFVPVVPGAVLVCACVCLASLALCQVRLVV